MADVKWAWGEGGGSVEKKKRTGREKGRPFRDGRFAPLRTDLPLVRQSEIQRLVALESVGGLGATKKLLRHFFFLNLGIVTIAV